MVEGVNAITYGKVIPSGSHSAVIPNVCVGCHMQPVATTHPAFGKAGGHTYSMTYKVVNGGVTNTVDLVDACVKCHGPIEDFNFARKDYDGDGVIDGVQTEVQHLLDNLSRLLPDSTYRADGNYVADGLVKSSISVKTNWPTKFLNAAWNWQFVECGGQQGRPQRALRRRCAQGLHRRPDGRWQHGRIARLLADPIFRQRQCSERRPQRLPGGRWHPQLAQVRVWGSIPPSPALAVPDGVVWANGTSIGGGTNTIHIYTAAEIAFDTEVGRTYQIQAISAWAAAGRTSGRRSRARVNPSATSPRRGPRPQQYLPQVVHTPLECALFASSVLQRLDLSRGPGRICFSFSPWLRPHLLKVLEGGLLLRLRTFRSAPG